MVAMQSPGGMPLPAMNPKRVVEVNDVIIHADEFAYYVTIWAEITKRGVVEFTGDWAEVTELAEFEIRAVEDEDQLDPELRNITGRFAGRDDWALVRSHVWQYLDRLADMCKEELDDNEAYEYHRDDVDYAAQLLADDSMGMRLYYDNLYIGGGAL